MDDEVFYFYIEDLNLVGKMDDYAYYIYGDGMWQLDKKNILPDRIMGYDASEPKDSPYGIGNTYMMSLVREITEVEANKLIAK